MPWMLPDPWCLGESLLAVRVVPHKFHFDRGHAKVNIGMYYILSNGKRERPLHVSLKISIGSICVIQWRFSWSSKIQHTRATNAS